MFDSPRGRFSACGTAWSRHRGEKGTEEDYRLLTSKGFQFVEVNGDGYYVLPEGPIVYLYPNGEWDCEDPKGCETLEEDLAYLELYLTAIRARF